MNTIIPLPAAIYMRLHHYLRCEWAPHSAEEREAARVAYLRATGRAS